VDGTVRERQDLQQLWLFTRSTQGLKVVYLDDFHFDADLSTDYLQLGQDGSLAVIQADDANYSSFFVFQITPTGEIQNQLVDYYVSGFVNHATQEIATIFEYSYPHHYLEMAVYKWRFEGDGLEKRMIGFDFPGSQDQAERLIFQDRNFPQAILYINEFLLLAPPELKAEDYPEWYRPYMSYLLALAYEMSGHADQACDAYFALWQDYPANIFGLAAEHRLVAVKR